jgi:hypothetical protein
MARKRVAEYRKVRRGEFSGIEIIGETEEHYGCAFWESNGSHGREPWDWR